MEKKFNENRKRENSIGIFLWKAGNKIQRSLLLLF